MICLVVYGTAPGCSGRFMIDVCLELLMQLANLRIQWNCDCELAIGLVAFVLAAALPRYFGYILAKGPTHAHIPALSTPRIHAHPREAALLLFHSLLCSLCTMCGVWRAAFCFASLHVPSCRMSLYPPQLSDLEIQFLCLQLYCVNIIWCICIKAIRKCTATQVAAQNADQWGRSGRLFQATPGLATFLKAQE